MTAKLQVVRLSQLDLVPSSHEDPADPGVVKQVALTKLAGLQGRLEMLNWSYLKPGRAFRPHYHQDMDEVFIILTGQVMMRCDSEEIKLTAGDVVVVPAGVTHSMFNPTKSQVKYIVFGLSRQQGGKTVVV